MRDSMKNKLIMYLEDDNIHCFVKKENRLITYHLLPKTLKFGKIIHRPKFQKQLKTFLKKNPKISDTYFIKVLDNNKSTIIKVGKRIGNRFLLQKLKALEAPKINSSLRIINIKKIINIYKFRIKFLF